MPITPDGPISASPIQPDRAVSSTTPPSVITPDRAVSSTTPPSVITPDSSVTSIKPDGPITSSAPGVPSPIATPHKYDATIRDASKTAGVDPNLMRALGMQESGLGSSSMFDSKTGLSRTGGNAGHGLFQLDPASGAPKADLDRAAKDPAFAAQYAAGTMKKLLNQNNGNLRAALAQYNSGNPASPQGLAYADSVMNYMKNDDNPDYSPEIVQQVKHDVKKVTSAIRQGAPLAKAISRTTEGKPIHELEVKGKDAWDQFTHNPVAGALDVLGAPQRAIGGFEYEAVHAKTKEEMLHNVLDMVFNPTEANQAKSTRGAGDIINYVAGGKHIIPTHDEIDAYVRSQVWIPAMAKPYVDTIMKTGEDLSLQVISDPTELTPVARVVQMIGSHTVVPIARATHVTAMANGIGSWFSHLPAMQQAGEAFSALTVGRRDLDQAGFTTEGKQARLALENAELSRQERANTAAVTASKTSKGAIEHLMQLVREHGSPQLSQWVAQHPSQIGKAAGTSTRSLIVGSKSDLRNMAHDLHTITPTERLEVLKNLHKDIANNEIARRTNELVTANPHIFTGNHQMLAHLKFTDTTELHQSLDKAERWMKEHTPVGSLAELGKRTVTWNPIPHGLVNVGTLAYQAGGIPAVMKGFRYMIKGPDQAIQKRLEDMGAIQHYAREDYSPTSAFGKFTKSYGDGAAKMLEHIELGWRAGLLSELDRKLGASLPGSVEELTKGQLLSSKLGDYRNIAAFTKVFRAMGGHFVMFRLGIVPHSLVTTLRDNPGRVVNQLRAMYDIQENRTDKHKNIIQFGGPTGDILRFIEDPRKFLTSPGSAGVIAAALAGYYHPTGLADLGLELAGSYVPGLNALTDAGKEASAATSGKQTFLDTMAQAIEEQFLEISHKLPYTGKQQKLDRSRNEKGTSL